MIDKYYGKSVELKLKGSDEAFTGIVLSFTTHDENTKKTIYFLKLKSGYNIGFLEESIADIKEISDGKSAIKTKASPKDKAIQTTKHTEKNKKTITILHTGGTIASKVDYATGAVIARFTPEEILQSFPELDNIADIESKLISNIMSENLRFKHINIIANGVIEAAKKSDGIIVTMGTDMLAYAGAALSFALKDLDIPVILVGSQRSSDRPSSDSFVNILCAAKFIAGTDFNKVALCMHSASDDSYCDILPGTKTRKEHSSNRGAFKPINSEIIAKIHYPSNDIDINKNYHHYSKSFSSLATESDDAKNLKTGMKALPFEDLKIGILKAHPNMFKEEFENYKNYDGLVIEATGLGHLPIISEENSKEHDTIKKALDSLAKKIPCVITTQCINGRVNLNVYSPGRMLLESGLMGNMLDMHPETAFIKLAFIISNYDSLCKEYLENGKSKNRLENIGRLLATDFAGELNDRILG